MVATSAAGNIRRGQTCAGVLGVAVIMLERVSVVSSVNPGVWYAVETETSSRGEMRSGLLSCINPQCGSFILVAWS